jgi:glyoxylase-like metal-dependent hydrolase (beta-lactamase superfamily II)/rhodanese-related sulfurtransferase
MLIDPVLEHVDDYLEYLKNNNLKLKIIIDTHTHADHISGAAALKDRTDCEYIMHENAPSKCVTVRVKDGDTIELDEITLDVIESNGHTRDSISLIFGDVIFTGDALFLDDGGAGRDDLPGGNPAVHWETLNRFKQLPDHLIVYPAHDYRDRKPSSLAQQKQTNPHLKDRNQEEFVTYLNDLRLGPADWMKDVLKANYSCAQDLNAAWIPVDAPSCEVKGTLELNVNEQEVEIISAEKLYNKIQAGQNPLLIDVREPVELRMKIGHIEGVRNIPIGKLIQNLSQLEGLKNQELVLVCRSGARAYTAAQIMKKAGFRFPLVLDGGMLAWNRL